MGIDISKRLNAGKLSWESVNVCGGCGLMFDAAKGHSCLAGKKFDWHPTPATATTYGPDTPPVVTRDRVKPLELALKAISADRNATHGEPEDVFAAPAALKKVWRKHNKNRKVHGKQHDEAIEMLLLKVARIAQGAPCNIENYTDVAGYAGNAYELAVAKGKRDALR